MKNKPIVLRELARIDIDDIVDHYLHDAGPQIAERFVATLEGAFAAIASRPDAGSPRFAEELNLPRLRSMMLKRFPYLIFYVAGADAIDVWRVLHARRDIPQWLQDAEGAPPE